MNSKRKVAVLANAESKAPPLQATAARELKIGFLIHDVSRLRRTMFDQLMKPLGVTRSQWWVIAHLSREDGMTQTTLAAMLDISKVSLGGLVDRLQVGGWIRRESLARDRRVNLVYLTQKSFDLLRSMQSVERMLNGNVLGGLNAVKREQLADLLGRTRSNLVDALAASGEAAQLGDRFELFQALHGLS